MGYVPQKCRTPTQAGPQAAYIPFVCGQHEVDQLQQAVRMRLVRVREREREALRVREFLDDLHEHEGAARDLRAISGQETLQLPRAGICTAVGVAATAPPSMSATRSPGLAYEPASGRGT